ncbi:MAG: putative transposase DNA-binding domain protein [Pelotomaculum sp. PtaB.Bin013]|uniref:Transposase n=1 Tax=Pelotomaculum isophthalicicum JI TaxID=947010 RepID=A0A9X4H6D2_9FIRM|nr:transposase [Pelotomaculum isophthalicicum]MDF9408783.1 transposase [Pelotomaculum isophthalicicum JI]OPX91889.1 MAG: putative transposase DNA-binding domain protein [Pelotomaculum sp. PtaB.Bin013]
MIRVLKTTFRTSKHELDRLFACNRESARAWNDCLSYAKEYHKTNGKWISKTDLQKLTKGRYHLHSQSIQAVQERYLDARTNAYRAKQTGYGHIHYPWRQKKNYPTWWKKDGFTIQPNGKIELSMGIHNGKREKPIIVHIHRIPPGKIKEIELVWDRKLMLAMSYDDGAKPQENPNQSIAAIDMGEIHGIAAVADIGEALLITSRKLRSVKRLRNKKLKELHQRQSHCKKDSRKWKKYTCAIARIGSKTDNQQRDILHKMSRKFATWANGHGVKTVVIGDVEGVQKNTSRCKKNNNVQKRRSRNLNQKLSQWPFGLLLAYLTYKLAALGIDLNKIDESYTTQTCPVCGRKKKPSGRIYQCHCGYTCHRDVHGAKNIYAKFKYGEIRTLDWSVEKIMYLRPAS